MNEKKCKAGLHLYIPKRHPNGSWQGCYECKKIADNKPHRKLKKKIRAVEWGKENPTYYEDYYIENAERIKWRNIFRHYKLTPEQYNEILKAQNYLCAVCELEKQNLCIDHDHSCCPSKISCGKCVRGLVCLGCNNLLGFCADNITTLNKGIQYLQKHAKTI